MGLGLGDTERLIVRVMVMTSVAPLMGRSSGIVSALGPALTGPAGGPSEVKAPHSRGRAGHAGSSTEDAPPLPPKVAVEGEVAASPGEAAGDAIAPGGRARMGTEGPAATRLITCDKVNI